MFKHIYVHAVQLPINVHALQLHWVAQNSAQMGNTLKPEESWDLLWESMDNLSLNFSNVEFLKV